MFFMQQVNLECRHSAHALALHVSHWMPCVGIVQYLIRYVGSIVGFVTPQGHVRVSGSYCASRSDLYPADRIGRILRYKVLIVGLACLVLCSSLQSFVRYRIIILELLTKRIRS